MNNILDEVAPVKKKMHVREKDVPYMTNQWKSAIRAKRKANDKYLRNKTPEIWEFRRKARNEATKQRRIAIRQFFKTFKPFLGSKSCTERNDIHLKINSSMVSGQQQVAEEFVEHFATLVAKKALKIGAKELSVPLTTLFNSCINKNAWPSEWKCGHWAPVYKKDDRNAKENYWPITLLPCVSKFLEKLVGAQINSGFGNRIYQNSSAYRKAHTCGTTLINLVEDWRLARDQKQVVSILSTDMSKAFDLLHPPLLLSKLEAYGFQESAIKLLTAM